MKSINLHIQEVKNSPTGKLQRDSHPLTQNEESQG